MPFLFGCRVFKNFERNSNGRPYDESSSKSCNRNVQKRLWKNTYSLYEGGIDDEKEEKNDGVIVELDETNSKKFSPHMWWWCCLMDLYSMMLTM